jgi:2-desacetyl-2-hydroxyethyl bacteriochlorophyllide A dehydrogenase
MLCRELWFTGPERVEVRSRAVKSELRAGQVRVRALASGISQGTELLLYRGEGPTPFDPSLDAPGAPTYPRRYGYAWVGEVVESQSDAQPLGTRIFALAPHGDEHCLDAAQVRALPSRLPAERAVLAASMETAVNVAWDAGLALGDDVVVMGGGTVGLLAGYAARKSGASRVRLLEPSARRRQAALALGFSSASSPADAVGLGADVVIEASGHPECLDQALALVRDEGVVVVASFYGQRVAPVALGTDFHRRRLSLRASQVSRLPPSHGVGWSFGRRFQLVSELLQDPALDALLDVAVPFAEAPATYARLACTPGDALQTVFSYV